MLKYTSLEMCKMFQDNNTEDIIVIERIYSTYYLDTHENFIFFKTYDQIYDYIVKSQSVYIEFINKKSMIDIVGVKTLQFCDHANYTSFINTLETKSKVTKDTLKYTIISY